MHWLGASYSNENRLKIRMELLSPRALAIVHDGYTAFSSVYLGSGILLRSNSCIRVVVGNFNGGLSDMKYSS